MSFLQLSSNDLKVINEFISRFIWAGRKPKIKLDVLRQPTGKGGWALSNFNFFPGQYKQE